MKQDVSVRVRGVQRCPGLEEETTELRCNGTFKPTEEGWMLSYEEPGEAGESVRALLRFDGRCVTLTRRGAVRSEMAFAEGECCTTFYELPVGTLTMDVLTDAICTDPAEGGTLLEIRYRLAANGETVSENRLTVELSPR